MKNKNKNFNIFFENKDLTQNELYSFDVVKSLARSILEPVAQENIKAVILTSLNGIDETQGIMRRLEYSTNVVLKEYNDVEFSKFQIEKVGFIVLNTQRYNCAFVFREKEENRYEIFLKFNSKIVFDVYKLIKTYFMSNFDEVFYEYRPERRENSLMNCAIMNIIKHFEETIKENAYNSKLQENYKTVNETNTNLRNEIYQNVRQIAHEIKNQVSILDIYTRIFEKKTGFSEVTEPLKKSISLIKSQIEQFKNIDVINLQERNIKTIIQETIKMYTGVLKEKNNKIILIDEMPGSEANVFVDEEKFSIVIGNIIKNANDSTKNDEIKIKLIQEDEKIKISFINHGEMIKMENKDKIFEQGYTTKKDGWGVGLAVCKKFIGSQFGTLELSKSDENETIFSIAMPLAQTR